MTKAQTIQLRAIEDDARAYEDSHGYDPDNQALLELAHEMTFQLRHGGTLHDAFNSCFNSYRDALTEAEADIMERIK